MCHTLQSVAHGSRSMARHGDLHQGLRKPRSGFGDAITILVLHEVAAVNQFSRMAKSRPLGGRDPVAHVFDPIGALGHGSEQGDPARVSESGQVLEYGFRRLVSRTEGASQGLEKSFCRRQGGVALELVEYVPAPAGGFQEPSRVERP